MEILKKTGKKSKKSKEYLKITQKVGKFIDFFVISGNATDAALKAGFAERSARQQASRMLTYANIKKIIEEKNAKISEELLITAKELRQDLIEVKERCMEAVEVKDKKGKGLGFCVFDAKGATRAIELLGRDVGAFIERKELKVDKEINVYIEDYIDE